MSSITSKLNNRFSLSTQRRKNNRSILQLVRQVNSRTPLHELASNVSRDSTLKPVAFFNASTRLTGVSLNAAFSLLASLGLQVSGVPVVRFACKRGMSLCVLGTDRNLPSKLPPCKACIAQSRVLFSDSLVIPFTYKIDPELTRAMNNLPLDALASFEVQLPAGFGQSGAQISSSVLPVGQLVISSIRWVLRRYHLQDDESTRFIFRQYILSANHVAREFSAFLDKVDPQAVVLFNGQFFPEAVARWICLQRGLHVITHEVGLQPYSAFFTNGEATAYPLQVPVDFNPQRSPGQTPG